MGGKIGKWEAIGRQKEHANGDTHSAPTHTGRQVVQNLEITAKSCDQMHPQGSWRPVGDSCKALCELSVLTKTRMPSTHTILGNKWQGKILWPHRGIGAHGGLGKTANNRNTDYKYFIVLPSFSCLIHLGTSGKRGGPKALRA